MVTRVAAFASGCVASLFVLGAPAPADAGGKVPPALTPPAGHVPYLRTHALGTQNYVCLAAGGSMTWKFIGPQATLFQERGDGFVLQTTTHVLSPNPAEAGVLRATWQHATDASRVWARAIATVDDPAVVAPGAVPWLLLEAVGTQRGPMGGGTLAAATYIQRITTSGGVAPSPAGCAEPADIGTLAFVPYRTDYVFFRRSIL
jgi:hypothetical protein